MMSTRVVDAEFHEGDEVVLAEGTYQGTGGVFLRLRSDVKWADITERDGSIRRHPVAWLARSIDSTARASEHQLLAISSKVQAERQ